MFLSFCVFDLSFLRNQAAFDEEPAIKVQFLFAILFAFQVHAATGEISGEVTLAKGSNLKPGGILFVFAKKEGVAMPAAVLRVGEPKFPLKFSISSKNAMTPGTPFDGPFIITSRYSPSGDAMDKSGPEGTTGKPVAIGAKDVKIEMKPK